MDIDPASALAGVGGGSPVGDNLYSRALEGGVVDDYDTYNDPLWRRCMTTTTSMLTTWMGWTQGVASAAPSSSASPPCCFHARRLQPLGQDSATVANCERAGLPLARDCDSWPAPHWCGWLNMRSTSSCASSTLSTASLGVRCGSERLHRHVQG